MFSQCIHLKTDPKRMLLLNNCYTTVSGHFFAMCMFIFHKTEVQKVILICLMGLNFNWFKSYGLKCILRLNATLANSQKMATDKWPFYDHFWSFFCQLYIHLSQNWGSNGHFEMLNGPKSWLGQKLWPQMYPEAPCKFGKLQKNSNW